MVLLNKTLPILARAKPFPISCGNVRSIVYRFIRLIRNDHHWIWPRREEALVLDLVLVSVSVLVPVHLHFTSTEPRSCPLKKLEIGN